MRLSSILTTAVAVFAFGTASAQGAKMESLALGSPVPMSTEQFRSVSGQMVSLDKVKAKSGLLVMFSCNTCPYVIKSQERTKEVMKYAKEKNVGMVIINSNEAQRANEDSYKSMIAYAKEQGYTAPYVVDEKSKLANAFGATRTPEVFLFDENGKLVYKGAMEDNPTDPGNSKNKYIMTAIDNMLAGIPSDPASTKSIGCSIKRAL